MVDARRFGAEFVLQHMTPLPNQRREKRVHLLTNFPATRETRAVEPATESLDGFAASQARIFNGDVFQIAMRRDMQANSQAIA